MLPPSPDTHIILEEEGNIAKQLLARGLPTAIFGHVPLKQCLQSNENFITYFLLDLSKQEGVPYVSNTYPIILCYNGSKELVRRTISLFDPKLLLAFADEAGCVEFLYVLLAQAAYGAILDFDFTDILRCFHTYERYGNHDVGIVKCTDLQNLNTIPANKEVFFSNVFGNYESLFPFMMTDKFSKVLNLFAPNSTGTIIVTPQHKVSQKIFWCE